MSSRQPRQHHQPHTIPLDLPADAYTLETFAVLDAFADALAATPATPATTAHLDEWMRRSPAQAAVLADLAAALAAHNTPPAPAMPNTPGTSGTDESTTAGPLSTGTQKALAQLFGPEAPDADVAQVAHLGQVAETRAAYQSTPQEESRQQRARSTRRGPPQKTTKRI